MNLRDWMSNSDEVLNQIPIYDRANRERMKILGLTWIVKEDTLTLAHQIKVSSKVSKRTILQQIASIYDPLGLYSPVILRGKVFLQHLWNQNISWDTQLSDEDISKWDLLCEDMKGLNECHFPRYIGLEQGGKLNVDYQLLVFCDASKYAYAAAVYLFQETTTDRRIDLIFSKTRLAPNKPITIPRLELLAALIGTRCLKFVQKELKVNISEKHVMYG